MTVGENKPAAAELRTATTCDGERLTGRVRLRTGRRVKPSQILK